MDVDTCVTNPIEFEWERLLQCHSLETQYLSTRKFMTELEIQEDCKQTETAEEPAILYYADIEKNQAFLREAIHLLVSQAKPPKENILFLLYLGNVVGRDESSFIQLIAEKVFQQLILLSKPTMPETDEDIKILFLNMLHGFLCHSSGVKWMVETNYCVEVYVIILQHQGMNNNQRMLVSGYRFLTTVLEKTVEQYEVFCIEFLKFLAGPILLTMQKLKTCSSTTIATYKKYIYDNIGPYGICLVEILERFLRNRSSQVLNFLLKLEVREAADNIASISDDFDFSINMYRISIILSFFEVNEIFNGINIINESVSVISGIHRIIERELAKGNVVTVFEIFHYVIKYSKSEGFNLPKHVVKDQLIDIESEYLPFQLMPSVMVTEYLGNILGWNFNNLEDFTTFVKCYITNTMLKECSVKLFYYGYEIRNKIVNGPVEIYLRSMDIVIRTISFYSMDNLNRTAILLVCTLNDIYKFFKEETRIRAIKYEEQILVEKIIEMTVHILETPNLCLDNKLKFIDIPTLVYDFLYNIKWPAPITIKGLRFLKLLIAKHMCPNMHLLIDSIKDSALGNIGHMLFVKLFSTDWEIRQVALNVVTTISHTANTSFSSFREILENASLPERILALCIEDRNPLVRAAAFKGLQEILVITGIIEKLGADEVTDTLLASVYRETDSVAKKEAVKLIGVIYNRSKETEEHTYLTKIYTCLEQVALSDTNYLVQQEVLIFWKMVESKYMQSIGWIDASFPLMTFSKKMIRMTNEEIGKRIFKILNDLSTIGCLDIIKHFCECNDLIEEVSRFVDDWLHAFHDLYRRYEVTENSIKMCEDSFIKMKESENEITELFHELFTNIKKQEAMVTSNIRMSPSEFVRYVYFVDRKKHKDYTNKEYVDDDYVLEY